LGETLEPGRRHLLALAASCGVRENVAVGIIDKMVEDSKALLYALQHSAVRRATTSIISVAVNKNISHCLKASPVPQKRSPRKRGKPEGA